MIISPWFWLAVLIFALVDFGAGYHNGYQQATDHADALQLQAVAKARDEGIEQGKRDKKTAKQYETARETVRTVYVKVKEKARENIANHPDYAGCSLDADGLRLYNHNPNDPAGAATGTHGTLSGPAASSGRQAVDDTRHQPGTIADVLRLPGASQSAGGVGGTGTAGTLIDQRFF